MRHRGEAKGESLAGNYCRFVSRTVKSGFWQELRGDAHVSSARECRRPRWTPPRRRSRRGAMAARRTWTSLASPTRGCCELVVCCLSLLCRANTRDAASQARALASNSS